MNLDKYKPSQPCSCDKCTSYCQRPGWPTPEEANAAMDTGYAERMMLDWWSDGENILILAPALWGFEGEVAPYKPVTDRGCTLLRDGKCTIHETGFKPFECRVAHHDQKSDGMHEMIARAWDTDEGRATVARWRGIVQCYDDPADDYDIFDMISMLF